MWTNLLSAIGKGVKKGMGAPDDPSIPNPTFPRDTATTAPISRPVSLPAPPAPPIAPAGAIAPMPDLSGEGVAIPSLPGRSGGPQPYSPMARSKYEHVMKGYTPPVTDPETREILAPGKFKRSFKDIALNAVAGLARGGIGGALAAGVGTAIDPMAGREFQFDELYRPEMERNEEQARTSRRQRIEDALLQAKADAIPRETAMDQARLEQIRVGNQVAIDNAKRQQSLTESQIELNNARKTAIATGQPKFQDIVDENGEVRTYQFLPDGTVIDRGASAKAAISQKNITSREKIATERNQSNERRTGMAQSGATGRTAMTQAGANQRQADRLAAQGSQGGGGKSRLRKSAEAAVTGTKKEISAAEAAKFAADRKQDPEAWKAFLKKKGYTIKD